MDAETEKLRRRHAHWVGALTRRGMDEARAELLASTPNVDLHAIVEALDAGCDPETAWRIWNEEPASPGRKPRKRRPPRVA